MSVVVFLGIKHCGKSTQARLLAEKVGATLLDSDDLLQKKYALEYALSLEESTPRAVMKRHGEEFFRRYEAGVIRDFLQNKPSENCVLALGGGVVDNAFLTTDEIKALGTLLYLKIDPETAYKRIAAGGIPPFLVGDDPHKKFLEICQKRMPRCEEVADAVISVPENPDAEMLAQEIFWQLEQRKVF